MLSDRYKKNTSNIWVKNQIEPFSYTDGAEIEERLLEILCQVDDLSLASNELQKYITDWPSEYHFSPLRANLLSSFQLEKFDSILEVGSGCGAITRQLGEKCCQSHIIALEGSLRRAEITRVRCRDLCNVSVCCDNFAEFKGKNRFDLLTMIGVLEYSPSFFKGCDSALYALEHAYDLLADNGVLVIAIENQLGLKYFNGCGEDHNGIIYSGINDHYIPGTVRTYGRKQLRDLVYRAGFKDIKFFYPFPDYKLPQLLLREESFFYDDLNLAYMPGYYRSKDYTKNSASLFDERRVWKLMLQNGVLPEFSNSFLLIISKTKDNIVDITDSWIVKTYSGRRIKKYLTETIITQGKRGPLVEKKKLFPGNYQKKTLKNQSIRHHVGKVEFVRGKPYFFDLSFKLAQGDACQEFIEYFSPWFRWLKDTATPVSTKKFPSGFCVPGSYYDCVPCNFLIDKNNKLQVIDQEWEYHAQLDLGFLLFRAIWIEFNTSMEYLEKMNVFCGRSAKKLIELIFNRFCLPFDEVILERYLSLEIDIQKQLICHDLNTNIYTQITEILSENRECQNPLENTIDALERERGDLIDRLSQSQSCELFYRARLKYLEREIEKRDINYNKLEAKCLEGEELFKELISSRSWKITRPLRESKKFFQVFKKLINKLFSENELPSVDLAFPVEDSPHNETEIDYYFDAEFYRDISGINNKIDPLQHYISYGWKKGLDPCPWFSTNYYLERNSDVQSSGVNPFLHYAVIGWREGRVINASKMRPIEDLKIIKHIFSRNKIYFNAPEQPVDIVIPVYNGFAYLEPLFKSILDDTSYPYQLLIIDDASSDNRVYPFLKKIREDNPNIKIKLFKNSSNLGFVKTVNAAVKHISSNFVILNTDTVVPRKWLQRLMYPLHKYDNVASVTPMTNSGTIFSFPEFLEDNSIFSDISVDIIDSYFKKIYFSDVITVPTGMGFCMGFNINVVKKIGFFDEETFGKGYGEENDWCRRAIKIGYKNIVVSNLYVHHEHGGSFDKNEKNKLIHENLKKLNKLYPEYDEDVKRFIINDPLRRIREFLNAIISINHLYDDNPLVIFDHKLGGGTNFYCDTLLKKHNYKEKSGSIIIRYNDKKDSFSVLISFKNKELKYNCSSLDEIRIIFNFINIGVILLNSIVSYRMPYYVLNYIISLTKKHSCKLIIPIHDYYPVCPNYVLLNYNGTFCNIPLDLSECNSCLNNKNIFKYSYHLHDNVVNIETWRAAWSDLFDISTEIICFSQISYEIIQKSFPNIEKEKYLIKPHKVDYIKNYKKHYYCESSTVIGVLGNIGLAKGAEIINELGEIIEKQALNYKIVVLGQLINEYRRNNIVVHGPYVRDELVDLVSKYNIRLFVIPSIWPETFSYTTEEVIGMDLPIFCFNIGAPAERVKKYYKGIVVKDISSHGLFEAINNSI